MNEDMYTPTAAAIAEAFALGEPLGDLVLVRRGDTDTWRLETVTGSYFVKGYWSSTAQFTPGGLTDQLEVAMAFENRALAAGIDQAEPIAPVDPVLGWITRINERLFRVYRWVESRPLAADDDITEWLGRTLAQVHQLQPVGASGLPDWWRTALGPRADWENWFTAAQERGKEWADLAWDRFPLILDLTDRIRNVCELAPDCVVTHGDFKTHNLLNTPDGPVLVDWDSVRVDSAALEAARVAYIFAAGKQEPITSILTAYTAAGGDVSWPGEDLFLSESRHDLHVLFEHVLVCLGELAPARWMTDPEQTATKLLTEFPGKLAGLRSLVG
ncbi:aminoglycoside phosphotransferase family protein [Kribbella capetownensis]|uniref:Aminoglycoside phosphotransferase family protein n=1 Tax=Kribbella capetownensis TaxID=1572659 RepID=A0A4R0JG78_9ACTN|nr:aminoglycoside phosphotransferase family protein [Kribbella capetownensis]TCC45080.1 aminoglycoside phosphotransferase family protein [Kribbella capetownensis]